MKNSSKHDRMRFLWKELFVIFLLGIAYWIFIRVTHIGIPCVFHLVTGLDCPGCGMTRAVVALLGGNIRDAISYNALLVSVVPLLLAYALFKGWQYINNGNTVFKVWEVIFLSGLLLVCIGYGIVRNIEKLPFEEGKSLITSLLRR